MKKCLLLADLKPPVFNERSVLLFMSNSLICQKLQKTLTGIDAPAYAHLDKGRFARLSLFPLISRLSNNMSLLGNESGNYQRTCDRSCSPTRCLNSTRFKGKYIFVWNFIFLHSSRELLIRFRGLVWNCGNEPIYHLKTS